MNRYFLDTSVIVNYLHEKKNTIAYVTNLEGKVTSSYFCLSELYEGVYLSDRKQLEMEQNILSFFESFSKIYGTDKNIARTFGKIRALLRKQGKIIEDIDIFLGATCLAHNLIMITYNDKHFRRIPNLQLLNPNGKSN